MLTIKALIRVHFCRLIPIRAINLCQHANMYEHVIVETLSGTFNAILGGNLYNVMLHVNAATLRGQTSFILCLI